MSAPLDPCFIDLETRSTVDLRKTGPYVYAEHPDTDVILLRYAFGVDGPRRGWRRGQPCPLDLAAHIVSGGKMVAHNAEFERVMFRGVLASRYGFPLPSLEQWECTAAMANAMALPRSLEDVGIALGLPIQKDKEGQSLMLRMCRPRKVHPDGTIEWWEDPERMDRLDAYCALDVAVTQAVYPRLQPLSVRERQIWLLDARINDRGVFIDLPAVNAAERIVKGAEKELNAELYQLTNGEVRSAKQVAAFRTWLDKHGLSLPDLAKQTIADAIAQGGHPPHVARALEIRAELSKSSTSKLTAMKLRRCKDGRARGNLLYHGATTGRWSGVGIQLQNLPRGTIKNPERCIPAVMNGDFRLVELMYGSALGTVSSALRSMITAGPGNEFEVADFSNIEGRVLAWLACEAWKVNAFLAYDAGTGPDIYKLGYSKSFGVPVGQVTGDQRQIGKVQELALGFGGGVGAFQSMAVNYGVVVPDAKADDIKKAWRTAHPNVVAFWYALEDAARNAIRNPGQVFNAGPYIRLGVNGGVLWMQLPSGKLLAYIRPSLEVQNTRFGEKEVICFYGVDSFTRKWCKQTTYGGKLAENATQATAREIMAEAMLRVEAAGHPVVLSVHDELVSEVPEGTGDRKTYENLMAARPGWASGLPISAEGWVGKRYKK